jgi:transcriptional regulator with XRE-family HTH domain
LVLKALKRVIYTLIVALLLGVSKVVNMITSRQIRAARALLGWSQQQLADKAIVSLNTVARLEKGIVDSRISTVQAVQKALVKAGIEFLDADQKGEGVRLKSPKS